jgi:hypothetical protein
MMLVDRLYRALAPAQVDATDAISAVFLVHVSLDNLLDYSVCFPL